MYHKRKQHHSQPYHFYKRVRNINQPNNNNNNNNDNYNPFKNNNNNSNDNYNPLKNNNNNNKVAVPTNNNEKGRYFDQENNQKQEQLQIYQQKEEIVKRVRKEQILLISGDTGSGKSTQTIQYLYEDYLKNDQKKYEFKALITQPRRIAAISLSQRVQNEMNSNQEVRMMDQSIEKRVGYIVGNDRLINKDSRIIFVTTGVLLRILVNNNFINNYSHLIIDEIHERDIDSDQILVYMKHLFNSHHRTNKNMKWFRELKMILMSATLNQQMFSQYFSQEQIQLMDSFNVLKKKECLYQGDWNQSGDTIYYGDQYEFVHWKQQFKDYQNQYGYYPENEVNTIQIESQRRLWIKTVYLNQTIRFINEKYRYFKFNKEIDNRQFFLDLNHPFIGNEIYQLAVEIIELYYKTCNENVFNTILVFLPGLYEIQKMQEFIEAQLYREKFNYKVIQLHRDMNIEQQRLIFRKIAQKKIILSTNIGESSITVPNCAVVIDFCLKKENKYDHINRIEKLQMQYCNKANLKQRQGRTGRVCNGHCFRLINERHYEQLNEFNTPEILRTSLESMVLSLKQMEYNERQIQMTKQEQFIKIEEGQEDNVFDDIVKVMGRAIESPQLYKINQAIFRLQEVGMLTIPEYQYQQNILYNENGKSVYKDCEITHLGRCFVNLPTSMTANKILLYSYLMNCIYQGVVLAALIDTDKTIFQNYNRHQRLDIQGFIDVLYKYDWNEKNRTQNYSDHLLQMKLYQEWKSRFMDVYFQEFRDAFVQVKEERVEDNCSVKYEIDEQEREIEEVRFIKTNWRKIRKRDKTNEEKQFIRDHYLNENTLYEVFEKQQEIALKLQQKGWTIRNSNSGNLERKIKLILQISYLDKNIKITDQYNNKNMKQILENYQYDLEKSILIELNGGDEMENLEGYYEKQLQIFEVIGLKIKRTELQDVNILIEFHNEEEQKSLMNKIIQLVLYLNYHNEKIDYAKMNIVHHDFRRTFIKQIYYFSNRQLIEQINWKRIVADLTSIHYNFIGKDEVVVTGVQENNNVNQSKMITQIDIYQKNKLQKEYLMLCILPHLRINYDNKQQYIESIKCGWKETKLNYFITNNQMKQVFNIRMGINTKINNMSQMKFEYNDKLFNELDKVLNIKDVVAIEPEDHWIQMFRDEGKLDKQKCNTFQIEEEDIVAEFKVAHMLHQIQGYTNIQLDMGETRIRKSYKNIQVQIQREKKNILESQRILEKKGKTTDCSLVCRVCRESIIKVKQLKQNEFRKDYIKVNLPTFGLKFTEYSEDPKYDEINRQIEERELQFEQQDINYVSCYKQHIFGYQKVSVREYYLLDQQMLIQYNNLETQELDLYDIETIVSIDNEYLQQKNLELFGNSEVAELECKICIGMKFRTYDELMKHVRGSKSDQMHKNSLNELNNCINSKSIN